MRKQPGLRTVLLGLGVIIVLALVGFAARELTAALLDVPQASDPPVATTTTADAEATGVATTTSTSTTTLPEDENDPVPNDDAGATLTVGTPTVIPYDNGPVPDIVSYTSGVVVGLNDFMTTGTIPTEATGPAPDDNGTGFVIPVLPVVDPVRAPEPQAFGVGIWTNPDSDHLATLMVGVNEGDNNLVRVEVDFGDGSSLTLEGADLGDLAGGGTMEIVHRYEPTLTRQGQTASVTAVDSSGATVDWSVDFTTRARFSMAFTPVVVTALGDCDFVGKGDFEMRWTIHGTGTTRRFDLGDGDSHVVEDFRMEFNDVFYDEPVFLGIYLRELDSLATEWVELITEFPYEFEGPTSSGLMLDVAEVGSHVVPYSLRRDAEDCDVRLDFAVTYALWEQPGV